MPISSPTSPSESLSAGSPRDRPPPFGKTSVLVRVADDVANAGTSVIWVDFYEVSSVADIALRFDAAINAATGPIRSRIANIAASVDLNLGF